MRQILVVAHQTVTGDSLAQAIAERLEGEPCEFTLVVPTTSIADRAGFQGLMGAASGGGAGAPAREPRGDPYMMARGQLDAGLAKLRAIGATVGGEVGREEPVAAIRDIVSRRQFDEIIISTLPRRVSRWLHQDIPRKVERKFGLPVTIITPG